RIAPSSSRNRCTRRTHSVPARLHNIHHWSNNAPWDHHRCKSHALGPEWAGLADRSDLACRPVRPECT
ncbi:hypothetical protein PMAYCL1PPCAC_04558, partial [Pristionchus mayeri]